MSGNRIFLTRLPRQSRVRKNAWRPHRPFLRRGNVMVMDKDEKIKDDRLAPVNGIKDPFVSIAGFSRI